jgi:CRISPR/Cas system CMR-associated protein Cmr5 small subunit
MNRAERNRAVVAGSAGALATWVCETVRSRGESAGREAYLARCKEFGLLLRAHGLAAAMGFYASDARDMRAEFAADLQAALGVLMPLAGAADLRNEELASYLLHSRQALRVADLFKHYANALLEPAPAWLSDRQAGTTGEHQHA